ncbi:MAG: hypothetical protein K2K53_13920 [Oscillospiraceae bacterium]|nr:hypothetical protein [Oscillospiraceae bacterium]
MTMEKTAKKMVLYYLAASALGVLLHFLFQWFPNPVTALISPVRESIWEHVKVLYFPLLCVSLAMGRDGKGIGRAPWLLAMITACVTMLALGYLYHVVFRGEAMAVDLALYFLTMALGFLLPRVLWPLCGWPGAEKAAGLLTGLLGALIVWFTFFPPDLALFADLSGALRTFLTIPV